MSRYLAQKWGIEQNFCLQFDSDFGFLERRSRHKARHSIINRVVKPYPILREADKKRGFYHRPRNKAGCQEQKS